LAIDGGPPVRTKTLPYGRQSIDESDIAAVVETLRSDWLTTGPKVEEFERAFAAFTGARHAVAVCNGTAALHAITAGFQIAPGDEVIVPAITFVASANCVVYQGGTPVFADVDADTLLIDPASVAARITPRTRAIIAVDYAGQPCDYAALRALAGQHGLTLIADACHALGGSLEGRPVGTLADVSAFSMHPVKPITTGEGGMITTDDDALARRVRIIRNHGITTEFRQREEQGSWAYEMQELGYNYRLSDIHCALGVTQLRQLPGWVVRRQEIAARFDEAFADLPEASPLARLPHREHAWHLYVLRLNLDRLRVSRAKVFAALRAEGINVNVHYAPVHLHPFYRNRFGFQPGLAPVAEAAYERLLTLPLFPRMTDDDIEDVITAVNKVLGAFSQVRS